MKKLHILFIGSDSGWVAQCLEHNIAAQGDSIEETKKAFEFALYAEAEYLESNNQTLEDLPPAPDEYWNSYEESVYRISRIRSFGEIIRSIIKNIIQPKRASRMVLPTFEELRLAG